SLSREIWEGADLGLAILKPGITPRIKERKTIK
ncbi:hypothetical protein DBR06_SOUSAS4110275, partial [Sousa chinensis]